MSVLSDIDGPSAPYGLSGDNYLRGREVLLRAILPNDYPFLRGLEAGPDALVRFRQRGVALSPENHVQSLWRGVLSQFLVVPVSGGQPLGLVTSYGADFRNGRSFIAIIVRPEVQRMGVMEALKIFIDYLFAVFPLRKLTAEVIEWNLQQFASGEGRMFETEGVLRNHEFHDGRYWDIHLLAIHRDRWTQFYSRPALERAGLTTESDRSLPMTFTDFAERLAVEFGWKPDGLCETTRLAEDLGADSVTFVELLDVLDSLANDEINEHVIADVQTLGELYHLFLAFSPQA